MTAKAGHRTTGGGKGNKDKDKKLGKWQRMDKLGKVKNEGSRSGRTRAVASEYCIASHLEYRQ